LLSPGKYSGEQPAYSRFVQFLLAYSLSMEFIDMF